MKHILSILGFFIPVLLHAQEQTTFDYYQQALSYSKDNDSINASAAFVKVNPYHLFYLKKTPANLDTFYKKLALTEKAKTDYRANFLKAWQSRSLFYDTLADLHTKYKLCRYGIDTTKSARMEDTFVARIYKIDSAFSSILYRRVTAKGWPSIEEGALYAWQMVLRDFRHYDYYYKAFVVHQTMGKGQLSAKDREQLKLSHDELRHLSRRDSLLRRPHIAFDVSALTDAVMPADLSTITTTITSLRPIKDAWLLAEIPRKDWADQYSSKTFSDFRRIYGPAEKMFEEFEKAIIHACNLPEPALKACGRCLEPGGVLWLSPNIPTIRKTPKMTLYVFPEH